MAPVRVPIFRSGHDGYGDARRLARPNSYNRVFGNLDMRWEGEIREGSIANELTSVARNEPPIAIFEWEDTVPNPLILYVADAKIIKYQGNLEALDNSLAATGTGACLHDDGSGVPYLYVAEGAPAGGTQKVQKRDRAATLTSCTNLVADKLLSIANDLYITATPVSGTAVCGIGKVPAGTNPSSAAQPALTVVGFAGTKINGLASERYAPVVLKPEGIYTYDRAGDTWINHAKWLERAPHPDNGKVFWYEGTDLVIALGHGGAIKFNGFIASSYDPIPIDLATPGHDTTTQLLAAGATLRHWGAMVTKIGAKRQQQGGGADPSDNTTSTASPVAFLKTQDNGGTYTDYSVNVADGKETTVADLSSLDPITAPIDYFLVGHVQPFYGVYFDMLNLNVNAATLAVSFSVAGGGFNAWPALSIIDGTNPAVSGASLGRSAWLTLASNVADQTAPGAFTWVPTTINGLKRYWMKIVPSAALSATVKVKTVRVAPHRPSLNNAEFKGDGIDRAGMLPHLLLSRTDEQGKHVTHDYGTLPTPDEIGAMILGPAGTATGNEDRMLFIAGRLNNYKLQMSYDDRPSVYSWPVQSTPVDTSGSLMTGGGRGLVELPSVPLDAVSAAKAFELDGYEFQRNGLLYYRFEDGRPWTLGGRFASLPVTILVPGSDRAGRELKVAVGWQVASTWQQRLPIAPRITLIDALVEPVADGKPRPRLPRITSAPVV